MEVNQKQELDINGKEIKLAAEIFKAVNNRLRQNMLRYLHTHEQPTVMQIYRHFKYSQPYISQQLGILRKAKLVDYVRDRNSVRYFVRYETLEKLKCQTLTLLSAGNN